MKLTSKNKWLIGGSVVALVAGGGYYYYTTRQTTPKVKYSEVQVKKEDFTETVLSTGSVAPENRLEIKPPVAGRIDQLLVKEGQKVKKGQILAWISSTERAAMLDSARGEDEAALKQWEQYYKPTPIYAPIDGVLILQNIWPGQSFSVSDSILTLSDRLSVKAQVDETDIAKIKLKQPASITLDAYPEDEMDAHVERIAYDAKTVNSVTTYIVDVIPEEVPAHMLSGMTANVTFILQDLPGSLLIPSEAVATVDETACVRIKPEDPKDTPVCKPIKVGPTSEKMTVVTEGLTEGQIILVPELRSLAPKNQDTSKALFGTPPRRH